MKTIRDCLLMIDQQTTNQLNKHLKRRLLFELCHGLNIDMYQDPNRELDPLFVQDFIRKSQRVDQEEPLGYILGYEWFYGYQLKVNQSVLIPRDETEELVGEVIADVFERYQDQHEVIIADVGTGSGAIAIACKKEIAFSVVYATDISEDACKVAIDNSKDNDAEITFLIGDMAQPLIDRNIKVDVCVCNPPYIKNEEIIQPSVQNYEPHVALFGGHDGFDLYRKLLKQAPFFIKEHGMIAFEIGFDQAEALTKEIKQTFPNAKVLVKKDINHLDRMVFVYF